MGRGFHEGVYQFKIQKILLNRDDRPQENILGNILKVSAPGPRQFMHTNKDGSVAGLKGPLLLSYQSSLTDQDLLATKQVILFLYQRNSSPSLELAAFHSWESLRRLVEVQSILVPE